ncbi:mite allergen Der p 7-like [Limulus polyphemus]|uniref:Mite allergen Der p 7-like n=1 Tax=Limulus polyphemus TaxID=6850 RepID=A0ABM1SYH0_LIMPO|nr:mite allergen Der p 7-like [Limulus polyphemus]
MRTALVLALTAVVAVSVCHNEMVLTDGNMNRYIDEVISNFRNNKEYVSAIDPFSIPVALDESDLRVTNIVVRGLSNLKRSGDVSINHNDATAVTELDGRISVTSITLSGNYWARMWIFQISGEIYGHVSEVAVKLILNADTNTGQVSLKDIQVVTFSGLQITKVTGLTFLFNWILKIIVNNVAQSMKNKIINIVQDKLKYYLTDILKNVKFPVI